MARADQIKALVRRHAAGDDEGFYTIALQLAAQAARQGHTTFSQELRRLVDEAREAKAAGPPTGRLLPLAQPRGDLAGLLDLTYPKTRLTDLSVSTEVRERLARIVLEQRQRDRLRQHALRPTRHVLLLGPPGTGKTMSASALAGELALPLFTIRLDGLITKYMGETAAKLRLVFEAIVQTRGVYLFDEVDALAGERALANDVGEIRRVLNSFLQFLEQETSDSLVLAATNHPRLLDRAVFRRFDAVLEFQLPDDAEIRNLIGSRLALFGAPRFSWDEVVEAARGLSQGEVSRACNQAAKTAVLSDREAVDTSMLLTALAERRRTRSDEARPTDAGVS
jgi:SpoVK/Ycf46/Vps4 family AAA+-type ATPase